MQSSSEGILLENSSAVTTSESVLYPKCISLWKMYENDTSVGLCRYVCIRENTEKVRNSSNIHAQTYIFLILRRGSTYAHGPSFPGLSRSPDSENRHKRARATP